MKNETKELKIMERLNLEFLNEMLTSLHKQVENSIEPQRIDLSGVNADNLHVNNMIKRGSSRYIVAGDVPCNCANGMISKREGHKFNSYPCHNCYHLRSGIHRIQRAHLPNDAIDSNLDDYIFESMEQEQIIRDILSIENPNIPPSLFMHGSAGNGKSTISYIIAKHLSLSGYNVRYIHHYHAFQKEKKSWSESRSYLDSIVDNIDVLILDEFGGLGGRSNYSDWFKYTTIELIGILYERYKANQLSIILTSNLDPKKIFYNLLDKNEMALSRLQNIFGNPLHMEGPDRRKKGDQVSSWI